MKLKFLLLISLMPIFASAQKITPGLELCMNNFASYEYSCSQFGRPQQCIRSEFESLKWQCLPVLEEQMITLRNLQEFLRNPPPQIWGSPSLKD